MIAVSAAAGYELWAETWDRTPSPIVALEQRILQPWVDALTCRRALDVGCGTGRWTACLQAIGIDLSASMLGIAAQKPALRGRLAQADAICLPIATASCDAAVCALTVGHLRDAAAAFRELTRVLQPGATLLLTDFHPAAAAQGWKRTFRRAGVVYQLEHYPRTLPELQDAAPGLRLEQSLDAIISEPEREIFVRAGKPELYPAACSIPAILLSRWKRV